MPRRRALLSGLVVVALLAATVVASYLAYDSERDDAMASDRGAGGEGRRGSERRDGRDRVGAQGRLGDRRQGRRRRPGPIPCLRPGGDPRAHPPSASRGRPGSRRRSRAAFEAKLGRTITRLGPDGGVSPQTASDDTYLPVAVTYPNTAARRQFLGLEHALGSDPRRRRTERDPDLRAATLAAAHDRPDRPDRSGRVRAGDAQHRRRPANGRAHDLGYPRRSRSPTRSAAALAWRAGSRSRTRERR